MQNQNCNKDKKVIAYDLGTGGLKSSLFSSNGEVVVSDFESYATYYPQNNFIEQSPEHWWNAIVISTKRLLEKSNVDINDIVALSISGHSLGVVPIGKDGKLLKLQTPIWSDQRATSQAEEFFKNIDYKQWYNTTGGGFPPACYSVFKIMWYKEHEREMYNCIHKVIGTKDYCNYRFTNTLCTDHSYASGTGVFNLKTWDYQDNFIETAGLDKEIFPEIINSDAVVGTLTEEASKETGLPQHVKVVCGGVDNSCMALGAKGIKDSRIYTSLGSSAWIALVSSSPVLDFKTKPYVFAHVIKGMYASATCIFSAGSSLQWVRNILCNDFINNQNNGGEDAYVAINKLAEQSPIGAGGVLFNPSLSGGSMLEPTPFMQGAFTGLKLSNSRSDMLRATMEGISLNLRIALDILVNYADSIDKMLIVGGGAKSKLWMQIFADCYNISVEKTDIDQQTASLGAAALAFKGVGIWDNYDKIDKIHKTEQIYTPNKENVEQYNVILKRFKSLVESIAEGAFLHK